jgi:hypothetical protein
MNTSEQINEVAAALAKAQGELKNPAKAAENPHFRNRYADLAGGLDAIRPVLSRHGLALTQMTYMDGEMVMLETRLAHASGQWMRATYPVGRFPMKHQEVGSAITYARRYSGFAICGIAGADDDDDGNEAQKVDMRAAPKAAPAPQRISDDESAELLAEMQDSLAMCESPDSVKAWAVANKANKARLNAKHQEAISAIYRDRLADVSQPMAAE